MPRKPDVPEPPKPRPVGRPRSNPDGAKVRAVRATDSEWDALMKCLAKLRRPRKPAAD